MRPGHRSRTAPRAARGFFDRTPASKRFGLFRPTAKAFLEAHQKEIEQHNQAHAITALAHNRSVPDHLWDTLKDLAR